ncbi:hypothetical protein G7Z17_g9023 [Cylindrodendrum hubeiense]|uniref:Epoxide hydrolase n=1 Tax=Cylindrodendrum hubeiense TaxID=595255 RepID=A0A9P5L614_9HYPO|nr:hypothetical protein G7Z17_g9023 [Cylindrodendrum hubeiense]
MAVRQSHLLDLIFSLDKLPSVCLSLYRLAALDSSERPMDGAILNADADADASPRDIIEADNLKRKVSRDDDRDDSPKRARHDDDDRDHVDRRSRRDSPPARRESYGSATNVDHDRRKSATQEEKKRGKRLFGGLLSTLSQKTGNTQQKRRLEIERRQQERQQKQRVEDEKERSEKLSRLTGIRRSEQVVFDEEVMRNKHSKMLAMAKFLRTKAHPQICYLPWKLTQDQEDEIGDQLQSAKATIEKELEAFDARKKRLDKDHGRPSHPARSATPGEPSVSAPPSEDSAGKAARSTSGSDQPVKAPDKEHSHNNHHHHNHHDESADVLEEADEDMPAATWCPTTLGSKIETAQIRGKNYKYIVGKPEGEPVDTMVLVHGFPDLGFGWRCQVPYFMSLGFQVVVPDMIGYGGTDAPEALEEYRYKSVATDIKELAQKFVGEGQIILGGHDWGGAVAWRIAMWYPELVKAVFSVCTPYMSPSSTFVPLEAIIAAGHLPNFTYQLQFAGPDVESKLQGKEKVRQFLNALYGGRGPNGEVGFKALDGVQFDNLPLLGPAPLLSEEELNYYTQEYLRNGAPEMRGPLNWYRLRKLNFDDELELAGKDHKFAMPALFITATDDVALPPSMSKGMDKHFDNLTRGEVKATHWALTQASEGVNAQVAKWANVVLEGALKASL